MSQFVSISGEDNQKHYINIAQIRHVHDVPAEDSVRIEFDDNHRLYLGRDQAAELLGILGKG